jgi:hypothetical protein
LKINILAKKAKNTEGVTFKIIIHKKASPNKGKAFFMLKKSNKSRRFCHIHGQLKIRKNDFQLGDKLLPACALYKFKTTTKHQSKNGIARAWVCDPACTIM